MYFNRIEQDEIAWKSSSLYIGELREDVNEQDLYEVFSRFGPLDSIKVCRNWDSGKPLGYGFLNYGSSESADLALKSCNFYPIKGKPCRLMWSTKRSATSKNEEEAANVYVKGLAREVDSKMLHEMFNKYGSVLSAKVASNKQGLSLGYGYVSFTSDSGANKAIGELNGKLVLGQIITVERFIEKSKRSQKNGSNVHVSNIPPFWTKQELEIRFSIYGAIRSAVIMRDEKGNSRRFGFVSFKQYQSAQLAIEDNKHLLANPEVDGVFSTPLIVTQALKGNEKTESRGSLRKFTSSSITGSQDYSSCSSRRSSGTATINSMLLENDLLGWGKYDQTLDWFPMLDKTTSSNSLNSSSTFTELEVPMYSSRTIGEENLFNFTLNQDL